MKLLLQIGQENDEGEQEGELEEVEGIRKPPRIPMPKFDHDSSQDVSHFLELFEKVAKQNGYPESFWLLAFRVAVAGTKLKHIAAYGETYDDIKKEVLLAHGHTAEQLWRQLTNVKQGDESFRQLFWRTITKLGRFFKLAVKAESLSVELVLDTLGKYMVLEGCSDELKEHFLEKTLSSLTCEEFQDIGSSFQEAHGRTQRSGRQSFTSLSSEESSTMNAWKVSAEDTVAKLEKMSVKDRRTFVFENRLCFNCLLPGHRGSVCRSFIRCTKCKLKHHSLLHEEHWKKSSDEAKVNMVSSQVDRTEGLRPSEILLMTAVVDVLDSRQQRHKVRAFFDLGAQASFVSADLVEQVSPQKLRNAQVTIQGFGSSSESCSVGVFQLELIDCQGTHHKIAALQKTDLNLCIPPISSSVVARWQSRGVELSDGVPGTSKNIQILIGADYINKFLIQKREEHGEVAWLSSFGWVLSGPSGGSSPKESHDSVQVAYIHNRVETLWEVEEPVGRNKKCLPAFPLHKNNNRYEVGLLWKNEDRPQDNRKQAISQAIALRKRLLRD